MTVRVGIVKLGNIGTSRFIDLVLDERADRENIYVRTVGAEPRWERQKQRKMKAILDFKPQFCIVISPNCTSGPNKGKGHARSSRHTDHSNFRLTST